MKIIAYKGVSNRAIALGIALYKRIKSSGVFGKKTVDLNGETITARYTAIKKEVRIILTGVQDKLTTKRDNRYIPIGYVSGSLVGKTVLQLDSITLGSGDPVVHAGPLSALSESAAVSISNRYNRTGYYADLYDYGTPSWFRYQARKGFAPGSLQFDGFVKPSADSAFVGGGTHAQYQQYLPVRVTGRHAYVGTDADGTEVMFLQVDTRTQCTPAGAADITYSLDVSCIVDYFGSKSRGTSELRAYRANAQQYAIVPLETIASSVNQTYNLYEYSTLPSGIVPSFKEEFTIGSEPSDDYTFEIPVMAANEQPYFFTLSNADIATGLTEESGGEWAVDVTAFFNPPDSVWGTMYDISVYVAGASYTTTAGGIQLSSPILYAQFATPVTSTQVVTGAGYPDGIGILEGTTGRNARYYGEAKIISLYDLLFDGSSGVYNYAHVRKATFDTVWNAIGSSIRSYDSADTGLCLEEENYGYIRTDGTILAREWSTGFANDGIKTAEAVVQLDASSNIISVTNGSIDTSISVVSNVAKNVQYVDGQWIVEIQNIPVSSQTILLDDSSGTDRFAKNHQTMRHTITNVNQDPTLRFDNREVPYGGPLRPSTTIEGSVVSDVGTVNHGTLHTPQFPWQKLVNIDLDFPAMPADGTPNVISLWKQSLTCYNSYAILTETGYSVVHEYRLQQTRTEGPSTVAEHRFHYRTYIDGELVSDSNDPYDDYAVSINGIIDFSAQPATLKLNEYEENISLQQNSYPGSCYRTAAATFYEGASLQTRAAGSFAYGTGHPTYYFTYNGYYAYYFPHDTASYSSTFAFNMGDTLHNNIDYTFNLDPVFGGSDWRRFHGTSSDTRTFGTSTGVAGSVELGVYGQAYLSCTMHWVREGTDGLCIIKFKESFDDHTMTDTLALQAEYTQLVIDNASDEALEVVGAQLDELIDVVVNNFATKHIIRLMRPGYFYQYGDNYANL